MADSVKDVGELITCFPRGLYFMITWGIIAAIEHITIQLIIPEMRSDAKGLYWVLKEKEGDRSKEDQNV